MRRVRLPFPELLYPYSPVAKPMPVPPVTDVCEGDLVCVQFSCSLIPYLLGLLEVYRYKDSFKGTDEEKTIAVGVMRQLMEVLAMSCCGDSTEKLVLKRLNPVTGDPEISTDNGVTWVTDPQSVYNQMTVAQPLQGTDGNVKRCEAANNVVENLQDVQQEISNLIGKFDTLQDMAIAVISAIVGILLAGLFPPAIIPLLVALVPTVIDMVRYLLNGTQEQYDALFFNEVWNTVRCIAYCHVSPNGVFTDAQYEAVKSDLETQLGSGTNDAGHMLASMVAVWTVKGLNNAARIGSGVEGNCDDCTDCGCTLEVTFDGLNWTDYGVTVGVQQNDKLQLVAHEYPLGSGWGCEVTIDMLTDCAVGTVTAVINAVNARPDHAVSLICYVEDSTHTVVAVVDGSGTEIAVGTDYPLSWNMGGAVGRYVRVVAAWLVNFGDPNSGTIDNVAVNP